MYFTFKFDPGIDNMRENEIHEKNERNAKNKIEIIYNKCTWGKRRVINKTEIAH